MEAKLQVLAGGKTESRFAGGKLEGVGAGVGRNLAAGGEFDWEPAVLFKGKFGILFRRGLLSHGSFSITLDIRYCFGGYDAKGTLCLDQCL